MNDKPIYSRTRQEARQDAESHAAQLAPSLRRKPTPDQEATMPEPQSMTLEDALMLAAERKWKVTFYGYPYSVLIEDDFGDDIAHEGNWPESFSEVLGRPVVERDDKAKLVEALKIADNALDEALYSLLHETPDQQEKAYKRLHKKHDAVSAALAAVGEGS